MMIAPEHFQLLAKIFGKAPGGQLQITNKFEGSNHTIRMIF